MWKTYQQWRDRRKSRNRRGTDILEQWARDLPRHPDEIDRGPYTAGGLLARVEAANDRAREALAALGAVPDPSPRPPWPKRLLGALAARLVDWCVGPPE